LHRRYRGVPCRCRQTVDSAVTWLGAKEEAAPHLVIWGNRSRTSIDIAAGSPASALHPLFSIHAPAPAIQWRLYSRPKFMAEQEPRYKWPSSGDHIRPTVISGAVGPAFASADSLIKRGPATVFRPGATTQSTFVVSVRDVARFSSSLSWSTAGCCGSHSLGWRAGEPYTFAFAMVEVLACAIGRPRSKRCGTSPLYGRCALAAAVGSCVRSDQICLLFADLIRRGVWFEWIQPNMGF